MIIINISFIAEIYGKVPQPDFAFDFPWLLTQNTEEGENAVYQFDDAPYQDGIPPELAQSLGLARVDITGIFPFLSS